MPIPSFLYKAICHKDTFTSKRRVMFYATAVDIALWSGIPQKMVIGGSDDAESIGFQRVYNPKRVQDIRRFYSERSNISHNPILCAVKSPDENTVIFHQNESDNSSSTQHGNLEVVVEKLQDKPFAELFGMLRKSLDARIGLVEKQAIPTEWEINALKKSLYADDLLEDGDEFESSSMDDENTSKELEEVPSVESHIFEFRKAIAAREQLCLEGAAEGRTEFAGFSKESLISFLLPIVLVDGQHRLRGALEAAHAFMESEEMQQKQLEKYNALRESFDSEQLESQIEKEKLQFLRDVSPVLPISLILDSDPAEQVFQFVVVNQKVVPVGKALLGTIVSTTLSDKELDIVRDRLISAGIPLENSRAITKLVVDPQSPFFNKVDRGLNKDASAELLQWTVLSSLVQIVRNLKGARLYHEDRGLDYADCWKEAYLAQSSIVSDFEDYGFDDKYQYWKSDNGPWQLFLSAFFNEVRSRLANDSSEEAENYWGRPKQSNIFNKVYLNILLADFFEFLYTKELTIDSVGHISSLVDNWLAGASADYFSKNWGLTNHKKDSTATRKKWSSLWHTYRRTPSTLKKPPKSNQFI